jgi:hypothetical protein
MTCADLDATVGATLVCLHFHAAAPTPGELLVAVDARCEAGGVVAAEAYLDALDPKHACAGVTK